MFDATLWAFVALCVFVGILLYVGIPKTILSFLDGHADRVRRELDQACTLRQEAEHLLKQYEERNKSLEHRITEMLAQVEEERKSLEHELAQKLAQLAQFYEKTSQEKIEQMYRRVVSEVKNETIETVIAQAERVLASDQDHMAPHILARAMSDLPNRWPQAQAQ